MIFAHSSPPTARRRPPTARGFTLLEMMVSLALVLVLMLAVTKIFSIASQTVGASQALSAGTRDAKAAQTVFTRDFGALAPDAGALTIYSGVQKAFRSPQDFQADRDGVAGTFDYNENNSEADTQDVVSSTALNARNHRVDTLGLFVRDRLIRQTGPNGTYIARYSSGEAYINYGHARQPTNAGTLASSIYPGFGTAVTNPNNFFTSQWILARSAILLSDPTSVVSYETATGNLQGRVYEAKTGFPLSPLDFTMNDAATAGRLPEVANNVPYPATSSRYDVAGTTIESFRTNAKAVSDPTNSTYNANWWRPLVFTTTTANAVPARFFVKPFISRPYDSENLAFTTPAFVTGCSQFVVEFAGDYIEQNPVTGLPQDLNGDTVIGPDGILDYAVLPSGTGTVRQIRWYGFPRKTSPILPLPLTAALSGANGDVVPLSAMGAAYTGIERSRSTDGTLPVGALIAGTYVTDWSTVVGPNSYYSVVWGPADMAFRPKMLRITLVIDRAEAQGRLDGGQTFEYVFTLP